MDRHHGIPILVQRLAQLLQLGRHLFRVLGSRRRRCEDEQTQHESDDSCWPTKCGFDLHGLSSSLSLAYGVSTLNSCFGEGNRKRKGLRIAASPWCWLRGKDLTLVWSDGTPWSKRIIR